jgi:uncharacterized protein YifE (UPF0438 family)
MGGKMTELKRKYKNDNGKTIQRMLQIVRGERNAIGEADAVASKMLKEIRKGK